MNAANQDWILDLREHFRRATKFANIDAEIPCKQNTQCQTMQSERHTLFQTKRVKIFNLFSE